MRKLILLLLLSTMIFHVSSQTNSTKAPKIFVESTTIDYGVVKQGSDGRRKIKVFNRGDAPLLITSCTTSCGCAVPTCPREPILPGKFSEVEVNYSRMNELGLFSRTFSITSNDPLQAGLTVTIKGEIKN